MMKHIAAGSILLALAGVAPATADDDCHVPMGQWQPREALQAMAEARGWQISRVKIDDGCYQIRGLDETGQAFKAKIDPATLSIVKMKRKELHDYASERRQFSEPHGTSGALPSNKLLENDKLPTSVIK